MFLASKHQNIYFANNTTMFGPLEWKEGEAYKILRVKVDLSIRLFSVLMTKKLLPVAARFLIINYLSTINFKFEVN